MRSAPLTFIVACCLLAGGARASSCKSERLHWARTSATGDILVGASFGAALSTDCGKTWTAVDAPSGAGPAAGIAGASFVAEHAAAFNQAGSDAASPGMSILRDSDGVQYTSRWAKERYAIVRSDQQGQRAHWTPATLRYAGAAPPRNAIVLLARERTLYFIGADDAVPGQVQAQALYRARNGKAEKLLDLGDGALVGARPLAISADGSMSFASHDKLWVSEAGGTGWTKLEGSSMTKLPWMMCYKGY